MLSLKTGSSWKKTAAVSEQLEGKIPFHVTPNAGRWLNILDTQLNGGITTSL